MQLRPAPRVTTPLYTVGHGTVTAGELASLLRGAGVSAVVDVRTAPGSRRNPQFSREQLETWMPAEGLGYSWERDLGGFRRPTPDSVNLGLRHPSFRAYADYMATEAFAEAMRRLVEQAALQPTTVMCSESLWWRCHRRLIADAATLQMGLDVVHIGHDGRLSEHRLTDTARLDTGSGLVVYDGGGDGGGDRA